MGAKLAYDFGVWRGQNEKFFSSRTINKAAYAYDGFLDSIVRSCKDLNKKLAVTNVFFFPKNSNRIRIKKKKLKSKIIIRMKQLLPSQNVKKLFY